MGYKEKVEKLRPAGGRLIAVREIKSLVYTVKHQTETIEKLRSELFDLRWESQRTCRGNSEALNQKWQMKAERDKAQVELKRVREEGQENLREVREKAEEKVACYRAQASRSERAQLKQRIGGLKSALKGEREMRKHLESVISYDWFGCEIPSGLMLDIESGATHPDDWAFRRERDEFVCRVMGLYLTPRERTVLEKRFGFHGASMTLAEAASEFNVSNERIRQIEAKAMRKLRHPVYGLKELVRP